MYTCKARSFYTLSLLLFFFYGNRLKLEVNYEEETPENIRKSTKKSSSVRDSKRENETFCCCGIARKH